MIRIHFPEQRKDPFVGTSAVEQLGETDGLAAPGCRRGDCASAAIRGLDRRSAPCRRRASDRDACRLRLLSELNWVFAVSGQSRFYVPALSLYRPHRASSVQKVRSRQPPREGQTSKLRSSARAGQMRQNVAHGELRTLSNTPARPTKAAISNSGETTRGALLT